MTSEEYLPLDVYHCIVRTLLSPGVDDDDPVIQAYRSVLAKYHSLLNAEYEDFKDVSSSSQK